MECRECQTEMVRTASTYKIDYSCTKCDYSINLQVFPTLSINNLKLVSSKMRKSLEFTTFNKSRAYER